MKDETIDPEMLLECCELLEEMPKAIGDYYLKKLAKLTRQKIEDGWIRSKCLPDRLDLIEDAGQCLTNIWSKAAVTSTDPTWARFYRYHKNILYLREVADELRMEMAAPDCHVCGYNDELCEEEE